ncbi:MAG: TRAP transporter small permease [Burkholderiaceae bacterium]|jgi:TRAP-type C4-dicarboxylate transport system permease small subunit
MSEPVSISEFVADDALGILLSRLCKIFAVASGVVLLFMAAMSLASILGRAIFTKPILGDYEMVQMMCAVAVSMALPYAHWANGHVIVDFFTAKARPSVNLFLDTIAGLLMGLAGAIMSWRLAVGMIDLRKNFDSSMLLGLPTWWGYAPMVPSFALLSAVAFYIMVKRLRRGPR